MRAAQTTLRHRPMLPQKRSTERLHRGQTDRAGIGSKMWFGAAFLAGYLPGIWFGRNGTSALGQQLAAYYAKSPESTTFAASFGGEFAVNFLQLSAVCLCGFCVWGIGLLVLLFAVRGMFLGFGAASAAAVNGVQGVVRYRTLTAFSDITTLLLCLWLAGWAAQLATELFRAVRGRPAREMTGTMRRVLVRYVASLGLSVIFSAGESFFVLTVVGSWR